MPVLIVSQNALREAFDLVLAKWPSEILPGDKTFHINGGCNMRQLNATHEAIEDWAVSEDFVGTFDEIIGSVEHYLFSTIHDALKNLTRVNKLDIDYEAFLSRFSSDPGFRVIAD